jgi:hypothetical protein
MGAHSSITDEPGFWASPGDDQHGGRKTAATDKICMRNIGNSPDEKTRYSKATLA